MLLHHLQLDRYSWDLTGLTPGGDHVAVMDTEQAELVAVKGTKLNTRK